MDRAQARVRPYRPADLDDLYKICLLTGDGGRDATSLYRDPQLPGHCFAAPYALFEPSLAFVAEDGSGVAGYIVGALDTQDFAKRLERDWWPRLRPRYPDPPPDVSPEQRTDEQWMAHIIHHPFGTEDELAARYPSHLHINLLPRLQGGGYGRLMVQTFIAAVRDRGSRGVHLYVTLTNERAASFYRHIGFTQLAITDTFLFGMELGDTR